MGEVCIQKMTKRCVKRAVLSLVATYRTALSMIMALVFEGDVCAASISDAGTF